MCYPLNRHPCLGGGERVKWKQESQGFDRLRCWTWRGYGKRGTRLVLALVVQTAQREGVLGPERIRNADLPYTALHPTRLPCALRQLRASSVHRPPAPP